MSRRRTGSCPQQPLDPDRRLAIVPGACLDEPHAIAEMQQITHDHVLTMTAGLPRTGVQWAHFHGEDAKETFGEVFEHTDKLWARDQFDAFFRQHGPRAVLILAMVEVSGGSAPSYRGPTQ